MKKVSSLSVVVFLIITFIIIIIFLFKGKKTENTYTTHNIVIQQIEDLGNLEVVKYNIQDIMEYEKIRQWLPNSRTSLKIVGEVIACVDLTKIEKEDIYTYKDSVSIILPIPEICHSKIDHSRSKIYNIDYGLWETTQLVDEAYKEAERQIYQEALDMGIAEQSRENAIRAITPLLRSLGFTKIHIGFQSSQKNVNMENKHIKIR